jgi:hypothetical protein
MDVVVIELLLWGGLIFFLWVLKDTMGKLESDIEHSGRSASLPARTGRSSTLASAESLLDPIGRYCDMPIYRYAIIDGKTYQFEHVCASCREISLGPRQRCLEPGLVYSEDENGLPRGQAGS